VIDEILPTAIVAIACAAPLLVILPRYTAIEARLLGVGYMAHLVAALAQVWITRNVYRGGDILGYSQTGITLAGLVRDSPELWLPRVIDLFLQREVRFPFLVIGVGTSTGTMNALSAFMVLFIGPSLLAASTLISFGAMYGNLAIYEVFREIYPQYRVRLLVACTLVPSVVFWSGGLAKEAVALCGFGWLIWGSHRVMAQWRPAGWMAIVAGGVVLALVKPYVLFGYIVAGAVWLYWRRAVRRGQVRVRPIYIALAVIGGIGGIVLLGRVFPRFAVENLIDEASDLQEVAHQTHGGSNYSLGGSRSAFGQIVLAPLALLFALVRPTLLDVRNAQLLVSAIETTTLTVLGLRLLYRYSMVELGRRLSAQPILMFCITFTAVFGVAVGLASTNLGTLSRYRVPLVPFYAALIVMLDAKPRSEPPAPGPARLTP
jgi:hypothetical protein